MLIGSKNVTPPKPATVKTSAGMTSATPALLLGAPLHLLRSKLPAWQIVQRRRDSRFWLGGCQGFMVLEKPPHRDCRERLFNDIGAFFY